MLGDRIEMSRRERDVLKVMAPVLEGHRTQTEAARLLQRSVRQVRRVQRRLEAEGDAGVIHRARGRPSNRRIDAALRQRVLAAYRQDYPDFGPTLAALEAGRAAPEDRGGDVARLAANRGPLAAAPPP